MATNIDYWERVLQNPQPAYKKLFTQEEAYLHAHIKPGSNVLDIGCGNGRTIKSLCDITQNIVGIDKDPKAIEDAKKLLNQYPDISVLKADATQLPFPGKTFDYVISMLTLVNFADSKIESMKEMRRVLKDDGKIILSIYSEKAVNNRTAMYEQIKVPIKSIDEGTFVFDESVGAYTSEQFSPTELEGLAYKSDLQIIDMQEVQGLAYICSLAKK